jgi:rubrerythrin
VRRVLRVELARLGHRICIECGYDLRGQVEHRCPECGTQFDLTKPPYGAADGA